MIFFDVADSAQGESFDLSGKLTNLAEINLEKIKQQHLKTKQRELNLSSNNLASNEPQKLSFCCFQLFDKTITSIDLSDNNFNDWSVDHIKAIFLHILPNAHITPKGENISSFKLGYNSLNTCTLKVLRTLFQCLSNRKLTLLDLNWNDITLDKSHVLQAFSSIKNTTIDKLVLTGNNLLNLETKKRQMLINFISKTQVKTINLSCTSLFAGSELSESSFELLGAFVAEGVRNFIFSGADFQFMTTERLQFVLNKLKTEVRMPRLVLTDYNELPETHIQILKQYKLQLSDFFISNYDPNKVDAPKDKKIDTKNAFSSLTFN